LTVYHYLKKKKTLEETGVPGENHRPAVSHWQTLSHNVVSTTPCLGGTNSQR